MVIPSKKKMMLHNDNASVHTSAISMVKIVELHYELLIHIPYSTDVPHRELFLFPNLKKLLGGTKNSYITRTSSLNQTAILQRFNDNLFRKAQKILKPSCNIY